MVCDYHTNTLTTVLVIICAIIVSSQCVSFLCQLPPCTHHSAAPTQGPSTCRKTDKWAGEYLVVLYRYFLWWEVFNSSGTFPRNFLSPLPTLSFVAAPPPFVCSSVSGVAILACLHCTFHPEVKDYLMRRYDNVAKTEVPPTCSVTT